MRVSFFVTATLHGQVTANESIPQTAVIEVNAAAVSKDAFQKRSRHFAGTIRVLNLQRTLGGTAAEPKPGSRSLLLKHGARCHESIRKENNMHMNT
jgi:hypothetical protein